MVPRWHSKSCRLREGEDMNKEKEKAMVEWSETAQELARVWFPSLRSRSRVKIDEDHIYDRLIDIWLEKGGEGPEFDRANRGQFYGYVKTTLGHSRDTLMHADSLSDIRPVGHGAGEAFDEDRIGSFSCSDDGDDDLDPAARVEKAEIREALGERLEELAAIRDMGLSGALAEIFGTTYRSGRTFASEVRSEKMLALIVDAARKLGIKLAEVKKLAAEIAMERRKSIAHINAAGGDVSYADIKAFEEMIGLPAPIPTATSAKTRLQQAKQRRKSVPAMQLELV